MALVERRTASSKEAERQRQAGIQSLNLQCENDRKILNLS
jgi:hypothetical protein